MSRIADSSVLHRRNARARGRGPWGITVLAVLFLSVCTPPPKAATRQYSLDIPDGSEAAYEVSFRVEHPGKLDLLATWTGPRVLSFRLEGPGQPPLRVQRSGPSPQRLQLEVREEALALGQSFKLLVRALPAKSAAQARLTLELPDPPQPKALLAPAPELPPAPDPAPSEPWLLAKPVPQGAAGEIARVFETLERFRASVVSPSGDLRPDPCSWQSSFLRHLAELRDEIAAGAAPVEETTRQCLKRLANAVGRVDALRTSSDPVLVGPIPPEGLARVVWRAKRNEKIRSLEQELDRLLQAMHEGVCPGLVGKPWPPRLVACLTACERYFEERVRLGEEEASNRELARDQWERYLEAGAVLEALTSRP